MAAASGVTILLHSAQFPLLEGARSLAPGNIPGGARTNREHFGPRVSFADAVAEDLRLIAFDPQTSGGLLIAVEPSEAAGLAAELTRRGVVASAIGFVESRDRQGMLVRVE